MTVIYVDADACPVKDEIITIAIRHGCRAVMVCNGGIRPHPHPLVDLAIVDDGPDAADIWIAQKADHDDIVVTNDIPLAARAVEKGPRCCARMAARLQLRMLAMCWRRVI